jgi:hypothetical protein
MGILYRYVKDRGRSELKIDLLDRLKDLEEGREPPEIVGSHYEAMLRSQLMHAKVDAAMPQWLGNESRRVQGLRRRGRHRAVRPTAP